MIPRSFFRGESILFRNESCWFAIQVKPGFEFNIVSVLKGRVMKDLFPGINRRRAALAPLRDGSFRDMSFAASIRRYVLRRAQSWFEETGKDGFGAGGKFDEGAGLLRGHQVSYLEAE